MADYGLDFETIEGRTFRLDDIQPAVYLGSYSYDSPQTVTFTYPEFAGIAELGVSCDYNESSSGTGRKANFIATPDVAAGELQLQIVLASPAWLTIKFSLFARFL